MKASNHTSKSKEVKNPAKFKKPGGTNTPAPSMGKKMGGMNMGKKDAHC